MNWHLRLTSVFGVLLLAAATFTNAQEKKQDPPAANYYPMEVGNVWNFKVTVGDNSAAAISKIAKIETIDKVELVRLEATVNGNVVATEHLRQTDKGIFRHRNNGAEISPSICLLKYPLTITKETPVMKWDGDIKVGAEKGKYSCEAKEETVEVTAGKFKAIRVAIKLEQGKGQSVNTTYWFVKDVGFVKQTVDAAGLSIVMELEKFERAKEAPKAK